MKALIVVDESVDVEITLALQNAGFEVYSIVEKHPGWTDTQVLEFAFEKNAYLITEDKDFGELTYRLRRPSHGILLIRLVDEIGEEKAAIVSSLLGSQFDQLWKSFTVLEKAKLRTKPI
jgi:predicted nuclease of predicted toxin-antitoxin system